MADKLHKKQEVLKKILQGYGRVAVAFSGGVDSTCLLAAAHEVLGDQVVALTARAVSFPSRETAEATAFCRKHGIEQVFVDVDQLAIDGFADNPPNRCYLCKKALFTALLEEAGSRGYSCLAEGTNADDAGDYRPGMVALMELGVKSPLKEAGLSKEEIRALSREMGLPTADKPSFACLATRIAYGEEITADKLERIGRAEQILLDLGMHQVRVRLHGDIARIEVAKEEMDWILQPAVRDRVEQELRKLGFLYVTLDLSGYRTGSMNKVLGAGQKG